MNRLAAIALTVAGMFLVVMAILVNSPPLFYMTVAVLATLGVSRLQAYLSVRGLRFERTFPPSVSLGERVTIETITWSERRIRRPLITIEDQLPDSLATSDRTPSLPIAPSFDQPIKSSFTFRPLRRGHFFWKRILVRGTDALGLVAMDKTYVTEPIELTVYPVPIPVSVDIRPSSGWGTTDLDSGMVRGSGIDPRGLREYVPGDAIKHIHWRSSARIGRLMVKEFDSGSGLNMAFVLQRTAQSDIGPAGASTFEAACGHSLYLALSFLERGAYVWYPILEREDAARTHPEVRARTLREILTDTQPTVPQRLSDDVSRLHLKPGTTLVMFLSIQDSELPKSIINMPGVRKICLVYDVKEFDSTSTAESASDPNYLAMLEKAGAEVHLLPPVALIQ